MGGYGGGRIWGWEDMGMGGYGDGKIGGSWGGGRTWGWEDMRMGGWEFCIAHFPPHVAPRPDRAQPHVIHRIVVLSGSFQFLLVWAQVVVVVRWYVSRSRTCRDRGS